MNFPRNVKAMHQLELTSRCNLRCVYCTSPAIVDGKYPGRKAVDMTQQHFERALEWVKFYVKQGTQYELNLAGIGESTMHPQFIDFVRLAREAVGNKVNLIFATNGLICSEAMVKAIAPYNPVVWVSLHRPEKAAIAIEMYRKYGLLENVSIDPSTNANSWAGQVKWHDSGMKLQCQWMRDGKVMVMADGRITKCCYDAQGIGVIGHVDDPVGSVETEPYSLCKTCHQVIDNKEWNQSLGVSVG